MIKDYLNEILDGSKIFDARSYPTNKRGVIALIESRTMKKYGTSNSSHRRLNELHIARMMKQSVMSCLRTGMSRYGLIMSEGSC